MSYQTDSEKFQIIKQAIIDKNQILATYDGLPREMCPHLLGSKAGNMQCLFYQFGGNSSTGIGPEGDPNNWQCMFVSGLFNVVARAGDWHPATSHSRPSTCVDPWGIVAEVQV
jgi:hypothetical protein